MNLILVVCDSLRADYLGCYGNPWVRTPCLDAFAREGVVFDNVYGEGLPTIPARRVFMTGRELLPFEDRPRNKGVDPNLPGWDPMREEDVALAEHLSDRGFFCGMSTDLWHFFKPTMNFHRGFHTWDFIRGHEGDKWRVRPKRTYDLHDFVPPRFYNDDLYEKVGHQYLYNTEWFRGEEDYFCARTMRSAVRWLENASDRAPFFLYIDTFDVHEPYDPPWKYAEMYYDDYPLDRILYGYWTADADVRDEDVPMLKALYAAKITHLDAWFGYLMDNLDRLGMRDDTVVVFVSDHGTEFREHGIMKKDAWTLYRNVTRLPLIARTPDASSPGRRVDALISAVDLAPTLLRLVGQTPPETMTGRDFWPTATGQQSEIREYVVSGYERSGCVRDHDWLYLFNAQPHAKHGKQHRQAKPWLYDLNNDPEEQNDVKDAHPEIRAKMLERARGIWPDAT